VAGLGWPSPQGADRAGGRPGSVKRAHQAARLQAIRLHTCSNTHLEEQGVTAPASIAQATGLSAAEAVRLLTRKQ
jgi:hypothetical protein